MANFLTNPNTSNNRNNTQRSIDTELLSEQLSFYPQYSAKELTLIVAKLNELYVMVRNKYLSMYTDSYGNTRWNTLQVLPNDTISKRNTLTDSKIINHLKQKSTLGVFSGQHLTKFICFDIDSETLEYSSYLAHYLIFTLIEDFNVPYKHIYTSFSGKKGFHVEIFFNEALALTTVEKFYHSVIDLMKQQSDIYGAIEFRPSYNQGVKFPLSIHKGTGNFCNYVDNDTLRSIEDRLFILTINPIDISEFKSKVLDRISEVYAVTDNNYFTLEKDNASEVEELFSAIKPKFKNLFEIQEDLDKILEENRLLRDGTRHITTFNLAIHLKQQSFTKEESIKVIKSIMINTWNKHREFISKDTEYEFMLYEIERLTTYVYEKDIVKSNKGLNNQKFKFYKGELLEIIEVKGLVLKKLLFSLAIHSKKFSKSDKTFYMAYSVIAAYGNDKNRSRVLTNLKKLANMNLIEIVQQNVTNTIMTKDANNNNNNEGKLFKISETNIYKMNLSEPLNKGEDSYIEIDFEKEDITLKEIMGLLLEEEEIKKILSKDQFINWYKKV